MSKPKKRASADKEIEKLLGVNSGSFAKAAKEDKRKKRSKRIATGVAIVALAGAAVITPTIILYKRDEKFEVTIHSDAENFQAYNIELKRGAVVSTLKQKLDVFEGHELVGLFKDANCTIPFQDSDRVKAKTVVYLKYEKLKYNITLPQSIAYRIDHNALDITQVEYDYPFMFKVYLNEGYTDSEITVKVNREEITPDVDGWFKIEEVKQDYVITVEGTELNEYQVGNIPQNVALTGAYGEILSGYTLTHGDIIEITYTIPEGYELTTFYVDGAIRNGNTNQYVVIDDISFTYEIKRLSYTLTVSGEVEVKTGDTLLENDSVIYYGEELAITYQEIDGYISKLYINDEISTENKILVTGDINIKLERIEYKEYTVTSIDGDVTIKNANNQLLDVSSKLINGEILTITVNLPSELYVITELVVEGAKDLGNNQYEVSDNISVTAKIEQKYVYLELEDPYSVVSITSEDGQINYINGAKMPIGENIKITYLEPSSNFIVSNLEVLEATQVEGKENIWLVGTQTVKVVYTQEELAFIYTEVLGGYELSAANPNADILSGEIVIPETYNNQPVIAVGDNAFLNNQNVTSIILADSVVSIGESAFAGSIISSIELKNVQSIKDYAFSNTNLSSLTISNLVTFLGDGVLDSCLELESVIWNSSILTVPNYIFNNCSKLSTITLPSNLQCIGLYSFANTNLASFMVAESLNSIDSTAFAGCTNLKIITINNADVYNSALSEDYSLIENVHKIYVESSIVNNNDNVYLENIKNFLLINIPEETYATFFKVGAEGYTISNIEAPEDAGVTIVNANGESLELGSNLKIGDLITITLHPKENNRVSFHSLQGIMFTNAVENVFVARVLGNVSIYYEQVEIESLQITTTSEYVSIYNVTSGKTLEAGDSIYVGDEIVIDVKEVEGYKVSNVSLVGNYTEINEQENRFKITGSENISIEVTLERSI